MNFRRHCFALLPVLLAGLLAACSPQQPAQLSPLASRPPWWRLHQFQETITRAEFLRLLREVYAPTGAADGWVVFDADAVRIRTATGSERWFTLRFAHSAGAARTPPRFWRTLPELRALAKPGKPLADWHIAIDPGHLGGRWARMEARWFQINARPPVAEGDLTLRVARLLAPRLQALGAKVTLLRDSDKPATRYRPETLTGLARHVLGATLADPSADRVRTESERLFYRTAEIRARADLVNRRLRPDFVLCLHFNAEEWGNPTRPVLTTNNHLHLLANGCYSAAELALDDVRFDMLHKLLARTHDTERALCEAVAGAMARATGLPPYTYQGSNALAIGGTGYVWARNLLANRLYRCPVVFLEPYVMNNREVFERIQAGDYEGEKVVAGKNRPSIFREYADAVAAGLESLARGQD